MESKQLDSVKGLTKGTWVYEVNPFHDRTMRQVSAAWLAEFNFSFFITLTYRKAVTSELKVRNDLRKLHRIVSQKAFGRNAFKAYPKENSISFFAIIEEHADGVLHIHMLLEDVSRKNDYVRDSFEHLPLIVFSEWKKLAGNPTQQDEKRICGKEERLICAKYCLKHARAGSERVIFDYVHKNE